MESVKILYTVIKKFVGIYKILYLCIAMKKTVLIIIALLSMAGSYQSFAANGVDGKEGKDKTTVIKADGSISRWCVSTNAVDWAWFVTPNANVQFSLSRHFTLEAGFRYNAWTYFGSVSDKRNRQCRQNYFVGLRYWPWYTYSGWWIGAKAQYEEYSRRQWKNIYRKEEGDAVGLGISAGYSIQLLPWLNLDFGVGVWGGGKSYKVYQDMDNACPECGRRVDYNGIDDAPSKGFFFMPNEVTVGLMFIF